MTDDPQNQALAQPQGALAKPQQQEEQQKSSVMAALEELEIDELRDYCRDISVNGVIAQTVSLSFEQGQSMWCSKGSLISYDEGIDWTLKIPGGAGKAVSRVLSGEGVSLTYTTANRPGASLTLGANQAGRLVTWDLSRGSIVCTSGSFVAALGNVDIDVTMAKKAGAAFFGGAGLFMQKLSGDGVAILHGSGDFIEKQLAPGEKVLVSTGNLAVFSDGVDYNIRRTGGCLKSIFGGEGIFMTELTGPGWVMMQSMKKLPVQGQGQQM
jgi:uncharacterized protein (AIM24 family)